MLQKISLFAKALVCILPMLWDQLRRGLLASWTRQRAAWLGSTPAVGRDHTNIVVGASFAGYTTARCLAFGLQPHSRHRIVVIEPSSHFQFSWVLPCYCVASGHEHKAFIPYGGYLRAAPEGSVRWVRDRVVDATKTCVKLGENGEIPYDYLVIATGSGGFYGLPSRVNQAVKSAGMERRLQAMQMRVKEANNIVIVGGGAAGVELAADAKDLYPKKVITLVHSRSALMHRFGKCLQDEALESLESLGVEVVLNDRVVHEDTDASTVRLESGRVICCDLSIICPGQKPASDAFSRPSSSTISPSGHIKIKPTLQIADDSLPNVYACGDVADTKALNTNAFLAIRQGSIVADNILLDIKGKVPRHRYKHILLDDSIKPTLGPHRSVFHLGVDSSELNIESKADEELMASDAWKSFGEKPYQDCSVDSNAKGNEDT